MKSHQGHFSNKLSEETSKNTLFSICPEAFQPAVSQAMEVQPHQTPPHITLWQTCVCVCIYVKKSKGCVRETCSSFTSIRFRR